jgi:methylmalonyl-CoA/ethylmalonyl-CoA epimerase
MVRYEAIEYAVARVPSPDEAAAPFERLGLRVAPLQKPREMEIGFRVLSVGGQDNLFGVEFFGDASAPAGAGFEGLILRVPDVFHAARELEARGVRSYTQTFTDVRGDLIAHLAVLDVKEQAATTLALIQFLQTPAERHATLDAGGLLSHGLPLKRFDHIATFTPNLAAATAFWTDVLGIPQSGRVPTATMTINQMRIGDAIVELIGPAGADSPMASRPPGLGNNAAFEVPDIDAAVAHARAAGFSAPDPRPGPLPGTRVSTVPANELGGIALQMLQYV